MPESQIDHHLLDWQEIEGDNWKSLLLGNGFSMNIWERFGYNSLYEVAQSHDIETTLTQESIALFNHIGSSNFEDVLRVLYHSTLVDQQLGSPQHDQIDLLYTNTKNSLAAAVNYAHVPPEFHSIPAINQALRNFKNVFTTNYDLIPYWSIMREETWRFKDMFWGEGGTFDITDTSVGADRCTIHYLHGAVHLVEKSNGKTKKLTANGIERLADLFDLAHPEQFPLFISEGSSEWKLSRIKRNDYLRFSYEKLCKSTDNLVVVGHSLHKDYDQHIIDAINQSPLKRLAISVWPHQSQADILSFKSRLHQELSDKELYFFNSETHPMGSPDLRIEV
ncbi:DUF4917 family protein [Stutzerimonas stutzeri]|uniref:DUF4917 family protein n=1 Tax=Stutzerimonas stutzeri TaxID=316 RepID=A0AA40RYE0_STUST|nr:DUF4917 family protein [Stutzerimonas stutzeri]